MTVVSYQPRPDPLPLAVQWNGFNVEEILNFYNEQTLIIDGKGHKIEFANPVNPQKDWLKSLYVGYWITRKLGKDGYEYDILTSSEFSSMYEAVETVKPDLGGKYP